MKTTFIALLLLILPGLCFGQKDETEIKNDIAEAVFRYEFEHFQKDVLEKSRFKNPAKYKATHFTITSGDTDFSVNKSGIVSKFTDVSPPVITVSAQLDKDVRGNSGYPITIEIKKIKILKAGLAEVETNVYIHSSDIFWLGKFTVTETDGKWTVILNKRKAGISLTNVYTQL